MPSWRKQYSPTVLPPRPVTPPIQRATSDNSYTVPHHDGLGLPSLQLYDVPTLHSPPSIGSSSSSTSPHNRPQHGRSRSNPFPSLFGSSKKAGKSPGKQEPDIDTGGPSGADSGTDSTMARSLPRTPAHKQSNSHSDAELITGRCATCDSTVRWPRHLHVYRCTVCLMVNDLQPHSGANGGTASIKGKDKKSNEIRRKGWSNTFFKGLRLTCSQPYR